MTSPVSQTEDSHWLRDTVPAMVDTAAVQAEINPGGCIARIDLYTYELTYRYGTYVMSGGRVIESLTSTVVCVTTEDGAQGWAETCPLGTTYLPSHAKGAIAALHELSPALIGASVFNLTDVQHRMHGALSGHLYAKSALDVACWDAAATTLGRPLCDLLGGRVTEQLPLYKAVPLGPVDEMVAFVEHQRSEGIRRFQLKVGADPREDAKRVLGVVEATDDGDRLIADANCGWNLQDAVIAARLLDGADRLLLEQPCSTLSACREVRKHTTLPMVLDEIITDLDSLLLAASTGSMEAINLKLSRVGGLTPARLIRDVCVGLGMRLTIEDTWGGDLTSAAVSHLGASTPTGSLFAVSFMNDWTNEHVAHYQPRSQSGVGTAPTGPGLGVSIDPSMLGTPVAVFS
jgi:cis-L-3-hydroxyproline dehydratase